MFRYAFRHPHTPPPPEQPNFFYLVLGAIGVITYAKTRPPRMGA